MTHYLIACFVLNLEGNFSTIDTIVMYGNNMILNSVMVLLRSEFENWNSLLL